ncbi:MAG: hypothetical protein ACYCRF_09815 [Acidithiobacillus sp.]
MADIPVIKIPVDDSAFKAFMEMFQGYADKVEELPEAWRLLHEQMSKGTGKETANALNEMLVSVSETAHKIKQATKEQSAFHQVTERSLKSMKGLAHAAGGLGKSLFNIGKSLFKMSAISLGLGGIGGLFGLAELASTGYNQKRTARGMGISAGMLESWKLNMQPLVGTGLLEHIASQQTQLGWKGATGLAAATALPGHAPNYTQAQYGNPAVLAMREILNLHRLLRKTPHALWAARTHAAGFSGFSPQDLRRINNASPAQIKAFEDATSAQAPGYNFGHGYTGEHIALQRIWFTLRQSLLRDLASLAGPISKAAGAMTGLVNALAQSPKVKSAIANLGTEINKLATFMKSAGFREDLVRFGMAIQGIGEGIWKLLRFFDLAPKSRKQIEAQDKSLISEKQQVLAQIKVVDNELRGQPKERQDMVLHRILTEINKSLKKNKRTLGLYSLNINNKTGGDVVTSAHNASLAAARGR